MNSCSYLSPNSNSKIYSVKATILVQMHCPKSVQIRSFFLSVFSRIWIEYGEILRISPYSVRMREIRTRKNSVFGHFSRSACWGSVNPNNLLQMICFKKLYKNYREKLLSLFWFLSIMSAVGHNIAHTIFHFLLEIEV